MKSKYFLGTACGFGDKIKVLSLHTNGSCAEKAVEKHSYVGKDGTIFEPYEFFEIDEDTEDVAKGDVFDVMFSRRLWDKNRK